MKKITKRYYFSVEGETEVWYLDRLKELINSDTERKYNVSFVHKKESNPISFVKGQTLQSKALIFHFSDYESNSQEHQLLFRRTMDNICEAERLGKNVKYQFGYSNFTFDLWIILHKANCSSSFTDRNHYLGKINAAFNENFLSMKAYKECDNFKRCLSKITLDDVRKAVQRSNEIMRYNEEAYSQIEYKRFKYYRENPSLEVGTIIGKILKECGLMA